MSAFLTKGTTLKSLFENTPPLEVKVVTVD